MKSSIPGGPALLLALPPGSAEGDWLDSWRTVLDAWPGDWHVLDPDPHYRHSWRRRALEHCAGCWTVMPDPGCVPGPLAFTLALRAMAEDARVSCVSIVSMGELHYLPELKPWSRHFYSSPFAAGGVLVVKGPLATKDALPEPRFYPYDFAEAAYRMTSKGLKVLILGDPSFAASGNDASLLDGIRQAWYEGRGGAAFRLAHKGKAPRSLRLPASRLQLLLLGAWLVPSTAWRIAGEPAGRRGPIGIARGGADALLRSTALWAGALGGYSIK